MLKGKTEIVLTDIKTGKRDKIIENNLVTNAISDILSKSYAGLNFFDELFPLYQKGLGGVYLFSKTIEEDKNNYIIKDNTVIGHAGNETSINSPYKGSFNSSESEILKNGYKYVWDFGTNQANGTIKSISLTSTKAGNTGFGGRSNDNRLGYHYNLYSKKSINSSVNVQFDLMDTQHGYKIGWIEGKLKITKYEFPLEKYHLTFNFNKLNVIDEKILNTEKISTTYGKYMDELYIYVLTLLSNGIYKIYKIDKGSLEIINSIDVEINIAGSANYFCVSDEFYYIIHNKNISNSFKIEKIDKINPTNSKTIEAKHGYSGSPVLIGDISGNIITRAFTINHEDEIRFLSSYDSSVNGCLQKIKNGLYYMDCITLKKIVLPHLCTMFVLICHI